ncbi:MAG TPA: hypothetical protein VJB41_02420 [Patescibacteria group bacterium]|nr:hypothetical protein [Patescibacteria group bacterium]
MRDVRGPFPGEGIETDIRKLVKEPEKRVGLIDENLLKTLTPEEVARRQKEPLEPDLQEGMDMVAEEKEVASFGVQAQEIDDAYAREKEDIEDAVKIERNLYPVVEKVAREIIELGETVGDWVNEFPPLAEQAKEIDRMNRRNVEKETIEKNLYPQIKTLKKSFLEIVGTMKSLFRRKGEVSTPVGLTPAEEESWYAKGDKMGAKREMKEIKMKKRDGGVDWNTLIAELEEPPETIEKKKAA